jgi:hypothetical protein
MYAVKNVVVVIYMISLKATRSQGSLIVVNLYKIILRDEGDFCVVVKQENALWQELVQLKTEPRRTGKVTALHFLI